MVVSLMRIEERVGPWLEREGTVEERRWYVRVLYEGKKRKT